MPKVTKSQKQRLHELIQRRYGLDVDSNNRRLDVLVPERLYQRLRLEAEEEDITISEMLRAILELRYEEEH